MKKIVTARKIVVGLLTWMPPILLGLVASFLCQQYFGLSVLQTNFVTFALGGAAYYGITTPLVDRYLEWSIKRELQPYRGDDN
jgi:hypothetical protein